MITDKHYDSALNVRLRVLLASKDRSELVAWLSSLSNSHFRTAGYMIGERFMPALSPDEFWSLFTCLCTYDSRAFLVTMLKALEKRLATGDVTLLDSAFRDYCAIAATNAIDRQKILLRILPLAPNDDTVRALFLQFQLTDPQEWIPYLIQCSSLPCMFVLFNSLRYVEHDRAYLVRVASFLIKRGDTVSFNLASVIKAFFGLEEVKGTFSLNLRPYELARIESSFSAFVQAVTF